MEILEHKVSITSLRNKNRRLICHWLKELEKHSLCTSTLTPAGGSRTSTDVDTKRTRQAAFIH